jgi:hypothetical protein
MATLRRLGTISASASGANATLNLADQAIGTDSVGLGIIAADASGPLGERPTQGRQVGLSTRIDNRLGTADAYLATPEEIPTVGTETVPLTADVIPAGSIQVFEDVDRYSWDCILRLLDGASVVVTVWATGEDWS